MFRSNSSCSSLVDDLSFLNTVMYARSTVKLLVILMYQ